MKKALTHGIATFSLLLLSSLANAAYPENPATSSQLVAPQDPATCFEDKVVKTAVPANLSSYGGFAVDVQYINIEPNQKCHVLINESALKQLFTTGNVSSAFTMLGNQTVYGSYTVMAIPRNDNSILFKQDSPRIQVNQKSGHPSDLVRFEMLGNDIRTDRRNFNIVLRMKTITGQVDSDGKPVVDSFTFNVSDTFIAGYRNYFLFSHGNQLIYVYVYPLKYPMPKR